MKLTIFSADQKGWIDPPVHDLLRQAEKRVDNLSDADVALVPIGFLHDFKFNEAEMNRLRGRRWACVCFSENGWDWDQEKSYLWGKDRIEHPQFQGEEYRKFNQFYIDNPPIVTFQRELLQKDRSERVLPIEYTAWLPESGLDSKEDFLKRPLETLFNWGRSSESRLYLHAAIFAQAPKMGYDVISDWSHIDKAIKENICGPMKWATIHAPHFSRIDVREVQTFCRRSKVGFILNGAGVKTFRDAETCQDFIMARPISKLSWSYPWDDSNSIPISRCMDIGQGMEAVKTVMDALMDKERLFELYCAAMENARNYRFNEYLRRWVVGNIERLM